MVNNTIATNAIWKILETVKDPEVPVLSVVDLGVIRAVALEEQLVTVTITPTYTGCPAMDMISMHIKMALNAAGYQTTIQTILSPAWTTDWITENGKQQLKAYGIAPPVGKSFDQAYLEDIIVPCPQCNSTHTVLVSQFGSTACKALYKCEECKEPFDYFKCH
ncbi:MAG: phenylacetate-CoA oxygenase subunit PaaJ [Sphingobacteriia bacterium 28-36-52]|jgi:ring-1,2-phenylacetyl-CoA epoxidase subunit PaaD|nr:MAG: phenylacetate-CoA oxygenase subunit PaaJ [Sphingobacteriia bacterium 32-37-4]OYZ02316.1 MAG: phenylacetate-CoA oxygenase subunit PaaJ [Sphingobacteriia bacterium 28-36-52]